MKFLSHFTFTFALTTRLLALGVVVGQELKFELNAYGTVLQVDNTELQYDQNQNHNTGTAPIISADHSTLHTKGNRWSAYELPTPQEIYPDSVLQFSFTLNQETEKGFQAICLDADREVTGTNGQCFVLSTTQGWIENMRNVDKMTVLGETSHISIPIGHFHSGTVSYIAFIQDSDGTDRSLGDSSFSDLKLLQVDRKKLAITINGETEMLENHQLSYKFQGGNQDTSDWLMEISENGADLQINGNQWKALQLNSPYNVTSLTIVEFDVVVTDPGDIHGICLDSDLNAASTSGDSCVSFMTPRDHVFQMMTTEIVADTPQKLVIPFGQMVNLPGGTKEVKYIGFVQDYDTGDKRGTRSTFSNLRIYEEDRMDMSITVFGDSVAIPNFQTSFSSSSNRVEDSKDHVMSVSSDGNSITATGNSWKRIKLDTPIDVTATTALKFSFEVSHEAEGHTFCLLKSNNMADGRNDCYSTSGKDIKSTTSSSVKIGPKTEEGEKRDYTIMIGTFFQGPVEWLGFAIDNDKVYTASRAEGESTWSDIEIYTTPSLNIGLNTGSIAIENNQITYESTSQDSVPIRDHMAIISQDGSNITANGNMWRALPLTTPMAASELGDFVVSFDYVLHEAADFHLLCFEENLEFGDHDSPAANQYDPDRCLALNAFETTTNPNWIEAYSPQVGESHHYAVNLSKLLDRFYNWNYLVLVQDSDAGDKSAGSMTISNMHITTDLSSCLKDKNFAFQVSNCTVDNFLAEVQAKMTSHNCPTNDPLLELMAFFDATWETEVHKEIEHICKSSYESYEYDFSKTVSLGVDEAVKRQLVKEHIDGGAVLNYEQDSEGGNLGRDGFGIGFSDEYAASRLMTWPTHHALDECDIGAAMCCWVDSRGIAELVDNTDVCYVDMKASRRSAHVADGWSIYGDGSEGAVNCEAFAWGTDGGSISSALKGNALFKVGFRNNLHDGLKGNVEQVPGAPMCGCLDRMPVVTNAACTIVSDDTSVVDVTYDPDAGAYHAKFTMGTIEYKNCDDFNSHYRTLVGKDSSNADFVDTRIVGDGGCVGAIDGFLKKKGLKMTV